MCRLGQDVRLDAKGGHHMRKLVALILTLCACALPAGLAVAQLPSQPFLTGIWEGTMSVIEDRDGGPAVPPFQGEQFPFRLDIRNTNLVFYFRTQDGWTGIGEGSDLRLNQEGRSAIVVASLPAGDRSETWMLNVTRWDEQNIIVHLSRVTSADEKAGQAPQSFSALGQMQRVTQ